jgi:hypothetical protein
VPPRIIVDAINLDATGIARLCFHQLGSIGEESDVPRGIAKALMHAHGFTDELIAGLVLDGFAVMAPDIAKIRRGSESGRGLTP